MCAPKLLGEGGPTVFILVAFVLVFPQVFGRHASRLIITLSGQAAAFCSSVVVQRGGGCSETAGAMLVPKRAAGGGGKR